MEPMTLGSPVNSPVQNPCSPGGTSMYLPSFLLGDTNIVGYNFFVYNCNNCFKFFLYEYNVIFNY